jgi:hypothetical protein
LWPRELRAILEDAGLEDVRLAGPSALARTLARPILRRLLFTPALRAPLLERCRAFDRTQTVVGMGKDSLIASGRKRGQSLPEGSAPARGEDRAGWHGRQACGRRR